MTRNFTYWPGDAPHARPKHAAKPLPLRSIARSWLRAEEGSTFRIEGAPYPGPRPLPAPARRPVWRGLLLDLASRAARRVRWCAYWLLLGEAVLFLQAKGWVS